MLTSTLFAALALTAVHPKPWACDLAPGFGQGSSEQGKVDSITTLNFGCRYSLFNVMGVSVSPQLGIDKQLWSVYQKDSFKKDISSYETNGLSLGFRLDRKIFSKTKVYYGFAAGQGKGTLNLTQSTSQSSLSASFSDLKSSSYQHTLGSSYAITENLSLSVAFQRQFSDQSWSANKGDILLQNVDDNNALTLTGGTLALIDSNATPRNRNRTATSLVQVGLSFQFGTR